MSGNKFGSLFQLITFGESHGEAIGGIIEGCPSGITLDMKAIQRDLDRRRPGQSAIVTQRKETDKVKFLSGIFQGKTTGVPIGFAILVPRFDCPAEQYRPCEDAPSMATATLSCTRSGMPARNCQLSITSPSNRGAAWRSRIAGRKQNSSKFCCCFWQGARTIVICGRRKHPKQC